MELQGKSILVKPDSEPEKTEGGVIIPKIAENKPGSGTVLRCGPGCEVVHQGSKIQYHRKSASIYMDGDDELHCIIEDNVFYVYE